MSEPVIEPVAPATPAIPAALQDLPLQFELLPIPGSPYLGLRIAAVVDGQLMEATSAQLQFAPATGDEKAIALVLNQSSAASLAKAMRSGHTMSAAEILQALHQHLDSTARLVGLAKEART